MSSVKKGFQNTFQMLKFVNDYGVNALLGDRIHTDNLIN